MNQKFFGLILWAIKKELCLMFLLTFVKNWFEITKLRTLSLIGINVDIITEISDFVCDGIFGSKSLFEKSPILNLLIPWTNFVFVLINEIIKKQRLCRTSTEKLLDTNALKRDTKNC